MVQRFFSFLLSVVLIVSPLFYGLSFAASTEPSSIEEYKQKVEACSKAVAENKQKEITEYICAQPNGFSKQDMAYQVIMDLEMKKIDLQVMAALDVAGNMSLDISNVDRVSSWFDERDGLSFNAQYRDVCENLQSPSSVLRKAIDSFWSMSTDNLTSSFIASSNGRCIDLVDRKMHAFRDTAMLLLARSFSLSYTKSKNVFMRAVKKRYELLINKLTIYIGQLQRIEQKYTNVTSQSNGGSQ